MTKPRSLLVFLWPSLNQYTTYPQVRQSLARFPRALKARFCTKNGSHFGTQAEHFGPTFPDFSSIFSERQDILPVRERERVCGIERVRPLVHSSLHTHFDCSALSYYGSNAGQWEQGMGEKREGG